MPEENDSKPQAPVQLFFSYAHEDETLRDELSKHLSTLKSQGIIGEWHDRQILPGQNWAETIDARIEQAQVILLLVSPDFLASEYCRAIEVRRALERDARKEAVVIPVILRPCSWEREEFGKLQALPKNGKPIVNWPSHDEGFLNVEQGIHRVIQELQARSTPPVVTPVATLQAETGRVDAQGFRAELIRRDVREMRVSNPYLLGERFVGRERELADLDRWLQSPEEQIFCICDLGGTGKSALVWHWLNRASTQESLEKSEIRQYWCSFYARNFDAGVFLRELASEIGGMDVEQILGERMSDHAQLQLQYFILSRLQAEPWLLVLDGLEREMGAFANPSHYQIDSEQQDLRNEAGQVMYEEKRIRSDLFGVFLEMLLRTRAKVLITSRLFPENLVDWNDSPLPGVRKYDFVPMPVEDAIRVWNLSGDPAGDPEDTEFQQRFFEAVRFHPQVISVVAAAVKEQSMAFTEWFAEFSDADREACLDLSAPLTGRRHRWLDLAVRDITKDRRDAWLTICYIVKNSEAGSIDMLMNELVDADSSEATRPGHFKSEEKLKAELDYLRKRRLIGVDDTLGMVDVHPVIRGQVMEYIMKPSRQTGAYDEEAVRHVSSGTGSSDWMARLLGQADLEERFQALSSAIEGLSDIPASHSPLLSFLGKFYSDDRTDQTPWKNALPRLRLRKDQARVLEQTAHILMTQGEWDQSKAVLDRAILAYRLCNDPESVEECLHSHDWQDLYNGRLFEAERHMLSMTEKGNDGYLPFWMALLLAIRREEDKAAELIATLDPAKTRWTLQTIAETYFYLERYEQAESLAREAWRRRQDKTEESSPQQAIWEAVTLGLALVRLDRLDEAEEFLDFAKRFGVGINYNIVPMFALAGRIELLHRRAIACSSGRDKLKFLEMAEVAFKQYRNSDPKNQFQIPAAETHLTMARFRAAIKKDAEALELARQAFEIAGGEVPLFNAASVLRRIREFWTEELKQPDPPRPRPGREALKHAERLNAWMEKRAAELKARVEEQEEEQEEEEDET